MKEPIYKLIQDLEVYDQMMKEDKRKKKHICPICKESFRYVANWRLHVDKCD